MDRVCFHTRCTLVLTTIRIPVVHVQWDTRQPDYGTIFLSGKSPVPMILRTWYMHKSYVRYQVIVFARRAVALPVWLWLAVAVENDCSPSARALCVWEGAMAERDGSRLTCISTRCLYDTASARSIARPSPFENTRIPTSFAHNAETYAA